MRKKIIRLLNSVLDFIRKTLGLNKKINKKYSWSDVTINMYKRMLALEKNEDYPFDLLAIFEGKKVEEILNQPIDYTLKCAAALNKFTTVKPSPDMVKTRYELNGKIYKLSLNPADINTAQYFDFVNTKKEIPENLAQILAIFMIPDGKTYNTGYDLESAVYDIDNYMNVQEALGVSNFFSALFQTYSKQVMIRVKKALKQAKKAGLPQEKIQEAENRLETYCRLTKYYK